MFSVKTYKERRKLLRSRFESGVLLFLGNRDVAMNYRANSYHFRQDSSFLYYWGLDFSGLNAVIDVDSGTEMLFGGDVTLEDQIWMGPQESLKEKAERVGVRETHAYEELLRVMRQAIQQKRHIHFLPQYRAENVLAIESLLGIRHDLVNTYASLDFISAVANQRSIKSSDEVKEIEQALEISRGMVEVARLLLKPGVVEREIAGAVEGLALSQGSHMSFPVICSVHGETLHNHDHGNRTAKGDLLVLDSGAESPLHYASDITRTFPVSGKFSDRQREIYEIVLAAQMQAITMIKPAVPYRDIHLEAARTIATGLKDLGLMKGDVKAAVKAGAHALFFQHGLGHMLGLDVHDMENLGEDHVGYDDKHVRSDQFGLAYLRLAKKLQTGFVVTVEPGIYFIPQLIDAWKSGKKFPEFINYRKVEEYLEFGGIRIEDDVLVTQSGHRVLGPAIPKTVKELENT